MLILRSPDSKQKPRSPASASTRSNSNRREMLLSATLGANFGFEFGVTGNGSSSLYALSEDAGLARLNLASLASLERAPTYDFTLRHRSR
eukprot:scaffold22049_cov59-Phaeocystis_antarctica.AAC.1